MIEIAGYKIDPRQISCIGPVTGMPPSPTGAYFLIIVDGVKILPEFESIDDAIKARRLMGVCPWLP